MTPPHLQLFLHVLGAILLFGASGTVAVLGLAARSRTDREPAARAAFWILLVLAVPAWVLMLAFGTWTKSKGGFPDGLEWISIGEGVADATLVILLVAAGVAYRWTRRPDTGWAPAAVGALGCLNLVALAVAWWVMTVKLPA